MTRVVINGESLYSSSCDRLCAEVPSNVQLRRCASSASTVREPSILYPELKHFRAKVIMFSLRFRSTWWAWNFLARET